MNSMDWLIDHLFDDDWLESVARYLQQGGDINRQSSLGGKTLLHFAADTGDLAAIQWLAHNGAQINSRDHFGWTPLLAALDAELGNAEENEQDIRLPAFELLLDLGADPALGSIDGYSVGSISASHGTAAQEKVASSLQRHGLPQQRVLH